MQGSLNALAKTSSYSLACYLVRLAAVSACVTQLYACNFVKTQALRRALSHCDRFFYISVATPAALIAIFSGTLLFILHGLVGGWLVLKLGGVVAMVAAHGAYGWLILRLEIGIYKGVKTALILAFLVALAGILCVLGLVWASRWIGASPP